MNQFTEQKPGIFSDILTSVINYQTTFTALADNSKSITTAAQWIEFLAPLETTLEKNISVTTNAQNIFSKAYGNVKNVEYLITQSIQDGWNELGDEEQAMVKIATQIGSLSQTISNLGANVTSAQLRAGKDYTQSMVTISYGIVMGTATSVPFLSFAGALFTIGYSAYSTISSAQEVQKDLDNLTQLQNEATEEAQAVAITKATIQLLNLMSEDFLGIDSNLPALTLLWQDELDKVDELINALKSGSNPALLYDLQTMKIASASWKEIAEFANLLSLPPQTGKSVTVNTTNHSITEQ